MSKMTRVGVFLTTMTLQGGSDSAYYFHKVRREKFEGRVCNFVQWIDNYLLYDEDEDKLLDCSDEFLTVCCEREFRVHAVMSFFLELEAHFQRILSEGRIRYDPRNLKALLNMKRPNWAEELQQILGASNGMRSSIPSYAELVAPLQAVLIAAGKGLKKKTKRALARVDITCR